MMTEIAQVTETANDDLDGVPLHNYKNYAQAYDNLFLNNPALSDVRGSYIIRFVWRNGDFQCKGKRCGGGCKITAFIIYGKFVENFMELADAHESRSMTREEMILSEGESLTSIVCYESGKPGIKLTDHEIETYFRVGRMKPAFKPCFID
jgi:hypothetical protein